MFFWSSKDLTEFRRRFGSLEKSPHLCFCTRLNKELVNEHMPNAVIFTGVTYSKLIADLYDLKYEDRLMAVNGHRLVERFTDGVRPWIFTKHWSGSRGFSKGQRYAIKNYIAQKLKQTTVTPTTT